VGIGELKMMKISELSKSVNNLQKHVADYSLPDVNLLVGLSARSFLQQIVSTEGSDSLLILEKLNRIEKRLFYYLILFTTINESKCVHSNKWRKLLRELLQIPFQDASLPKSCVLAEVLPLTYANKSKKAEGKRNSVHNLFKSVSSLIRIFLYLLHLFTKSGKSK
jgi:hypothetical protein